MEVNKQEDMDVLFIMKSIKRGLLNVVKSVNWLIEFSVRKFMSLLLYVLIGVAISLGLWSLIKPYYTSHISVSHIRFENDYCSEAITNLNAFTMGTEGFGQLGEALGISEEKARLIKTLRYLPLNAHLAERYQDSINVLLPFKVEVEVYNNSVLDSLQIGIINYLESNEYAKKRKVLELQSLQKTEKRIMDEILATDSLKQLVNQGIIPRSSGNGIILGEPIDPIGVYKRGLELYERQLFINRKQQLNNTFDIIVGFTKKSKPSTPGPVFYVTMGILFGYLAGLLWLLRRNQKLKTTNQ